MTTPKEMVGHKSTCNDPTDIVLSLDRTQFICQSCGNKWTYDRRYDDYSEISRDYRREK